MAMLTDDIKAAIREEVSRQLDEREEQARADLDKAQELHAMKEFSALERNQRDEAWARISELEEAVRLALKFWHSDHPNDTVEATEAHNKIIATLGNKDAA